jgi:hypothetical protein
MEWEVMPIPAKSTSLRAIVPPLPLRTSDLETGMWHSSQDSMSPSTFKVHGEQSGNQAAMSAQIVLSRSGKSDRLAREVRGTSLVTLP